MSYRGFDNNEECLKDLETRIFNAIANAEREGIHISGLNLEKHQELILKKSKHYKDGTYITPYGRLRLE